MQSDSIINFPTFIRRPSALLMAAICGGWLSTAHAAPNCNTMVATPADGVIPAGTTITNNEADACFDNAVTPIVNKGQVTNNAGAGLTNAGSFTASLNGKFWNYGTFNNYAGAQFNAVDNGSVRNYGVLTNNGTWTSGGATRNEGQWTNAAGATMQLGGFDHYSGAVFTNNGSMTVGDSAVFSGATFNNNGTISNPALPGLSSIQNQGLLNNNSGGSIKIKSLVNSGQMSNAGTVEVEKGSKFSNTNAGTKLVNKAGSNGNPAGRVENYGTIDNRKGAVIENEGVLVNNDGGLITNTAGQITNTGTIDNKQGSELSNADYMSNAGSFNVRAGSSVTGAGNFVQYAGGTTTIDGSMTQGYIKVHGGDIKGSGQVHANDFVMHGGRIESDGLSIDGAFRLMGGSVVTTIGANDFTVLNVVGTAYLSYGTFVFDFGSYIPEVGESWTFLTGDIVGTTQYLWLDIHQLGDIVFALDITSSGLRLTAVSDPSAVPVPGAAWLFGSALVGLVGSRKYAKARKPGR